MEVVVALGVFAMIALAGAAVMIDSLHVAGDNRERVRAANLADQEIERSRAAFRAAPAGLADGTTTETVESVDYTVERNVTWVDSNGAGGSPEAYTVVTGDALLVEVRVRWPSLGDRPAVITTTVLS